MKTIPTVGYGLRRLVGMFVAVVLLGLGVALVAFALGLLVGAAT